MPVGKLIRCVELEVDRPRLKVRRNNPPPKQPRARWEILQMLLVRWRLRHLRLTDPGFFCRWRSVENYVLGALEPVFFSPPIGDLFRIALPVHSAKPSARAATRQSNVLAGMVRIELNPDQFAVSPKTSRFHQCVQVRYKTIKLIEDFANQFRDINH